MPTTANGLRYPASTDTPDVPRDVGNLAADLESKITLGAWTAYTPTLAQGVSTNIAKTVTYAKYMQIGKLIIGSVKLDITGTGTAGSPITCTLPVTALQAGSAMGPPVGAGAYFHQPAGWYKGVAYLHSTTQIAIGAANDIGQTGGFGINPAAAALNLSHFQATFIYQAA